MIHSRLQILDERSVAPDVQALQAEADAQDWLVHVECILKQQLVCRGPCRVCLSAFGNWIFAISLRVNITVTTGQQDSLYPREQPGYTVLPLMQRDQDRLRPCRMKGEEVLWQCALVIGRIGTCRFRNCDVDAHGEPSLLTQSPVVKGQCMERCLGSNDPMATSRKAILGQWSLCICPCFRLGGLLSVSNHITNLFSYSYSLSTSAVCPFSRVIGSADRPGSSLGFSIAAIASLSCSVNLSICRKVMPAVSIGSPAASVSSPG